MKFDAPSYIMGYTKGKADGARDVILSADAYTFADDGQGNITVTEEE